ncbi:apolipoprotein N-acyltransferase [Methylohalomonas lacus]|uniref:Apolipoprotein N-acyltransferase n=1 Tax=Methylohalomonas lacus TaxID=398773 RepID=A0AAE3HL35_9GAMM|nr:DUF3649 domain-containing protein [Methylohalomonas lacus]MCS3903710.1 apolipoprotein N-acyltransferase [Methylohalomonas lacus]
MSLASRIAAALFGGYAVAYFAAAALAVILPLVRSEAAVTAMLLGLLVYAAAVMWVFSARSAAHAWLVLLIIAAVCAAVAYLPGMLS